MSVTPKLLRKHQGDRNELLATVWLMDRGFEVYRNVSSRGPVDLVALKGFEVYKFDVKKCRRFPRMVPPRTDEQIALGVKTLAVYDDGHCEIIDAVPNPVPPLGYGWCKCCAQKFEKRGRRITFCSSECSQTFHIRENNRADFSIVAPKDF